MIARRAHPDFPLVVAANRDEVFARAAAPLATWDDAALHMWHSQLSGSDSGAPRLLTTTDRVTAGRDLAAGGTWLAVADGGRFSAVTNVREPGAPAAPLSRGELPLRALAGAMPTSLSEYGPVNVVFGDVDELWYAANRGVVGDEPMAVPEGIVTLSNASLDTPWPKSRAAAAGVAAALDGWSGPVAGWAESADAKLGAGAGARADAGAGGSRSGDAVGEVGAGASAGAGARAIAGAGSPRGGDVAVAADGDGVGPRALARTPEWASRLLAPLLSRERAPLAELPRTGLTLPHEWFLSSPFVRLPGYGTRCQTAVAIDRDGLAHVVERRFDQRGRLLGVVGGTVGASR